MKIDDSTFVLKCGYVFLKKWVRICLTICIFKSFFVFEGFYVEVPRQVTLVSSGDMQSSSSGSTKRTRFFFFLKRWSKNFLSPLLRQLFILNPLSSQLVLLDSPVSTSPPPPPPQLKNDNSLKCK